MKRSKKHHTFTEKHKFADRHKGQIVWFCIKPGPEYWYWRDPVPAWFRKMYNSQRRAQNKQALYKLLNVRDDAPFASEKRSIRWDWW